MSSKWILGAFALASLSCLGATPANAQAFRPFDAVPSVCPTCPTAGYDRVHLKDGQVVEAVVVAENSAFYVLRKFWELRPVGRDQVASIEHSPTAVRESGHEDQILLQSGLVLSGKIVNEFPETGFLEMQMPGIEQHAFAQRPLIAAIYKDGQEYRPQS